MSRGKRPVLVALCAALLAAPAARAAWQLFDLGAHHRRVSTRSEDAQRAFDQGLIWSFAFNHEEAERAFREAARLDTDLAIAWWGVALVNGPHINNTTVDEAHAKAAWEALGEARRRLAAASPVERALVEALGTRYAWPQPADRAPLDEAYARAMASVHARFPSDADVAVLAAEALMDVRPWDQWTHDGRPQPGTREVLRALEEARALDPKHPGALHLTIHALESSPRPERAKTAADGLRRLVPDASHLLHMPAHVDVRLGLWKQAAEANERAIEADARYSARTPEIGFYRIYQAHNTHFLAYTAMMEGRRRVAIETTAAVVSAFPSAFVKENAMFADAFMTVHGEALKRFGMWKEILELPAPDAALPVSTAYAHALRGTAHAALGHVEEARTEQRAFEEALAKVPREFLWGSNTAAAVLAVLGPYLEGEIAFRAGDRRRAIARLREAVEREDALKYDEPPPMTVPSRHALGAVLLAAGRPKEAEAVYTEDLRRYPANGWALLGLSRALRAQGRIAESAGVLARRRRAWARADVEVTSSCLCVPGT